jgi:hypothetical protein
MHARSPCRYKLQPLRGCLHKKHQQTYFGMQHFGHEWSRRHFEVDDFLGVIYYFRTFADAQRRIPSRIYPLSDICRVVALDPLASRDGTFAFELRFRHTHRHNAAEVTPPPPPVARGEPVCETTDKAPQGASQETLQLACDSRDAQTCWVRGLHCRMVRDERGGSPPVPSLSPPAPPSVLLHSPHSTPLVVPVVDSLR